MVKPVKTVVMIPTYNEAENIVSLLDEILALDQNIEVLVVDDQSPDGTAELVEKHRRENAGTRLLLRDPPRGRGLAGIDGLKLAVAGGADYIIEMDADFSHDPKRIPALIDALQNAHAAFGSRFVHGGKDADRGAFRRSVTKFANAYTRFFLGVKVRDCTSGYRAYRRETLEAIDLDSINAPGPEVLSDILYRINRKGFHIAEIPIAFTDRKLGTSTLGLGILLNGFLNVLKLAFLGPDKKL